MTYARFAGLRPDRRHHRFSIALRCRGNSLDTGVDGYKTLAFALAAVNEIERELSTDR